MKKVFLFIMMFSLILAGTWNNLLIPEYNTANTSWLIPTTTWKAEYEDYGLSYNMWTHEGTYFCSGKINGEPGYYVKTVRVNNTRAKICFTVWEMQADCCDDGNDSCKYNYPSAYIKVLAGNSGADIKAKGRNPVISVKEGRKVADLITKVHYSSSIKKGSAEAIIKTAVGISDWYSASAAALSAMDTAVSNNFKSSYTAKGYAAQYNKGKTYSKAASIGLNSTGVLTYAGHQLMLEITTKLPEKKYLPKVYKRAKTNASRPMTFKFNFKVGDKIVSKSIKMKYK